MSVKIIAAIGRNYELGGNNALLWHLPGDMKFFRETTKGATVIMGRLTYESIGRPLPKRRNIVISGREGFAPEGAEVCPSLESALEAARGDDVYIIGGASVYKQALPLADELILTEIDAEFSGADVFFPKFDKSEWEGELLGENSDGGINYRHMRYTKRSGAFEWKNICKIF